MSNDEEAVKVVFRYGSPVLEETVVETMWATVVNESKGIYKLDNIPFYGPPIAPNDEFFAEFDENEQRITFRYVTKHSGYSVILVVMMRSGFDKEMLRDEFRALGCTSEGFGDNYFAMEIPASVDYSTIKPILEKYSSSGIIDYSEPVLSDGHRKNIGPYKDRPDGGASFWSKLMDWASFRKPVPKQDQ